jgi:PAS domain-containing protein
VAKRNPFAAIAHGHDLAEAIVDAIREPLLVLDPDLRVIAASRSFYRTFAVTPRKTEGRVVFTLGDAQRVLSGPNEPHLARHTCVSSTDLRGRHHYRVGFTDLIQAIIFQRSSSVLMVSPKGGIGPTTNSDPLRV